MPAASAAASSGGTSTPLSPSTSISGMPPTAVATIGRASAIASSNASGNGSRRAGWTSDVELADDRERIGEETGDDQRLPESERRRTRTDRRLVGGVRKGPDEHDAEIRHRPTEHPRRLDHERGILARVVVAHHADGRCSRRRPAATARSRRARCGRRPCRCRRRAPACPARTRRSPVRPGAASRPTAPRRAALVPASASDTAADRRSSSTRGPAPVRRSHRRRAGSAGTSTASPRRARRPLAPHAPGGRSSSADRDGTSTAASPPRRESRSSDRAAAWSRPGRSPPARRGSSSTRPPAPPRRGCAARAACRRAADATGRSPRASCRSPRRIERPAAAHQLAEPRPRATSGAMASIAQRRAVVLPTSHRASRRRPRRPRPRAAGVRGEDARAIAERDARHDEAPELHQVAPATEPHQQPSVPRPIVIEEDDPIVDHLHVRRHEVAVHEARLVQPPHLEPRGAQQPALGGARRRGQRRTAARVPPRRGVTRSPSPPRAPTSSVSGRAEAVAAERAPPSAHARNARRASGAGYAFTQSAPSAASNRTVRAWRERRPSPLAAAPRSRPTSARTAGATQPRHPPSRQRSRPRHAASASSRRPSTTGTEIASMHTRPMGQVVRKHGAHDAAPEIVQRSEPHGDRARRAGGSPQRHDANAEGGREVQRARIGAEGEVRGAPAPRAAAAATSAR